MKNITTKQFQILTDINLVWDFMTDIYKPYFANGVAAPFFEYAVTSAWMNKEYLHFNRFWMDKDQVAAFVFTESSVTSVFFNLRPGYEELADEMIAYKLTQCTWNGFHAEELGPFENWDIPNPGTSWNPHKAYQGVLSSTIAPPPHATYEYNVIIANEAEDYVCFSGMWWVPENRLAYMEPLCTVPEYRNKGLAAAALTQHYRRLKALGAEYMTGGGNDFYRRIGYEDGIHWLHWKKENDMDQATGAGKSD